MLSFAAPVTYPAGISPLAVATADFNGDGRSDVVAAYSNNAISVRLE